MLDRIVEVFCEVDDFSQGVPAAVGGVSDRPGRAGPTRAAAGSVHQRDRRAAACAPQFRFQTSQELLSRLPPSRCCAAPFPACPVTNTSSPCRKVPSCRWCSSSSSHLGTRTGLYYIDLHGPCRCHNQFRHQPAQGLRRSGPTWQDLDGLVLRLQAAPRLQHRQWIVALKLTPGNVHDTTPVPALTRELTGKLFGDKAISARSWPKTCCVAA